MGVNNDFELSPNPVAQTSDDLVITWTSNEPTASNTQTIADGTVPTVAELGQSIANLTEIVNQLVVDVGVLRTSIADAE